MLDKVLKYITQNSMIKNGDKIVVGFSGGPDSTALLHILIQLKNIYNIEVFAVHINHMIRDEEAFRDEEFSREFCKRFDIPFYSFRIDVLTLAKDKGLSSEEAGRLVRYECFEKVLKEVSGNKIALAHNKNDQAETMIMKFLRGSGLRGISGIKPVRGNIIRPLLVCSREEIEEYCKKNNLNPVIDSTNKEAIYLRNKIRLELMPYIKENINENIIDNLFKASEILREEDEYIEMEAVKAYELVKADAGISISRFKELHIAIQRRIIRNMIKEVKGDLNAIENIHVDDCLKLIEKGETGKKINLPKKLIAEISYDNFYITLEKDKKDFEYKINIPGTTVIGELNLKVSTELIKNEGTLKDSAFIKYFDYDKIKGELVVRNRKEGDFIYPKGLNGKKKIKDLFIDNKIPKDKRDEIPLIALGKEILWVYNIRDTKNYKIDENTKNVLKIKIERG
ncbi:MAG: tRNA lysidine(34) synthetase TilS [Caloramator sp.]|nr:tRNA lysidine(34) synthetase TilS [Caloramator sp.]